MFHDFYFFFQTVLSFISINLLLTSISFFYFKQKTLILSSPKRPHNKDGLWRKVLIGKYGIDCLYTLRNNFLHDRKLDVSPMVRSIIEISSQCFDRCCSRDKFCWKFGKGSRIDFWTDRWYGTCIFSSIFNSLFMKSKIKVITVEEMVSLQRRGCLKSLWQSDLSKQDFSGFFILTKIIFKIRLSEKDDSLVLDNSIKSFSSGTIYNLISCKVGTQKHWDVIWSIKIPARIKMCVCLYIYTHISITILIDCF